MEELEVTAEDVLYTIVVKLHEKRMRAIDLFRKIDTSGDGSVTAEEFRGGLLSLGFAPSQKEFDIAMSLLDRDGSGSVTLKEFDRALKKIEKDAAATQIGQPNLATTSTSSFGPSAATKKRQSRKEMEQTLKRTSTFAHEPVGKLEAREEVLVKIKGKLNRSKTRMIDVFRRFDTSGDGILSHAEFRTGLKHLGVDTADDDFKTLVAQLDKDNSGDVSILEFDKALKLVEKKARLEGRGDEVDTWEGAKEAAKDRVGHDHFDWSRRSFKLNTEMSQQLDRAFTSRSISENLAPPSKKGTWHVASRGQSAVCTASSLGNGSVWDASVTRQRLFETAPGALPPTLKKTAPWHRAAVPQPSTDSRWTFESRELPTEKLEKQRKDCVEAHRGRIQQWFNGGTKKFTNTPMMQSTVDQVVFNRDMDFSGDTKFDPEFMATFEGMAGIPSWHYSLE